MISYKYNQTVLTSAQTELFLAGNKRIILRDNTTYDFNIHGTAKDAAGNSAFNVRGAVSRGVGAASVVLNNALPVLPVMETGIARDIAIVGDTTYGALTIFGTGAGVWHIEIELYPNPDYFDFSSDYQAYLDEVSSMIKDEDEKLSATDLNAVLQKAITDWGRDEPLLLRKKIEGNGTGTYLLSTILTDLWQWGHSKISKIEYPIGDKPATYLPQNECEIYDDGTAQDGSNLSLRLLNSSPASGTYFIIEFYVQPILTTEGLFNFPNTRINKSKITTLASYYACQRLAAAYAQSSDGTITADVVNYHDKSGKYTSLSKEYKKAYNGLVFGAEQPASETKAAISQKDVTPISKTGNSGTSRNFLFH
jgi:hypothetical protein